MHTTLEGGSDNRQQSAVDTAGQNFSQEALSGMPSRSDAIEVQNLVNQGYLPEFGILDSAGNPISGADWQDEPINDSTDPMMSDSGRQDMMNGVAPLEPNTSGAGDPVEKPNTPSAGNPAEKPHSANEAPAE